MMRNIAIPNILPKHYVPVLYHSIIRVQGKEKIENWSEEIRRPFKIPNIFYSNYR